MGTSTSSRTRQCARVCRTSSTTARRASSGTWTPRGLGVIVNKVVGTRTLRKRICVRFEHVKPSRCRAAFQAKTKAYREFVALKKAGKTEVAKKASPRAGGIVRVKSVETLKKRPEDFDTYLPY